MPQHVRPLSPERGDRPPYRRVFARGVRVDEAGVGDFPAGGAVYAMDLGVREGFECL